MLSTSQNNAHLVFLDIFNGVADQLAPIAAVLRPNYNNFAAAVAAFPFSQLTDATKKALKAVTDNADLYLELGTLEAEASSSRSALNSIWMADPNGIRNRPHNVDNWFIGSFKFNVQMTQQTVSVSTDACLQTYKDVIVPFFQYAADIVIKGLQDTLPKVPTSIPNAIAAVPGAVAQTNHIVQVLNSCAVTSATSNPETCIKNFVRLITKV